MLVKVSERFALTTDTRPTTDTVHKPTVCHLGICSVMKSTKYLQRPHPIHILSLHVKYYVAAIAIGGSGK